MSDFATYAEIAAISGKTYTTAEQERINTLLPLVEDALRVEARKSGKDLDTMAALDDSYASTVKLVVTDIVVRIMRQSLSGDPLTQVTQSALGYSATGTYAIPGGGGIASAIMRNDLKRLGLKRQRMGVIDLCPTQDCCRG